MVISMKDKACADAVARVEELGFKLAGCHEFGDGFPGFAGKLPAHFARLAIALHVMATGANECILAPATAEWAERLLCDHLLHHAVRFYASIDHASIDRVREVAGYLLSKQPDRVTAGKLGNDVRCCRPKSGDGRRAVDRVTPIMEQLVTMGWVIPETDKPDNNAWVIREGLYDKYDSRIRAESDRRTAVRQIIRREAA